jgi:hypothetical protein
MTVSFMDAMDDHGVADGERGFVRAEPQAGGGDLIRAKQRPMPTGDDRTARHLFVVWQLR